MVEGKLIQRRGEGEEEEEEKKKKENQSGNSMRFLPIFCHFLFLFCTYIYLFFAGRKFKDRFRGENEG